MIFPNFSKAATWHVRTDGGDATQCTGLADAPYPGSGTSQDCALNHLFWLLKPNGLGGLSGAAVLQGGDTVIIGEGEYKMGIGAPNSGACSASWAYGCTLPPLPSGPDAEHPTKIYGKNWDTKNTPMPQLWGYGRASNILSLAGSNNIEIRYLEITDHSACLSNSPDPAKRCDRGSPYDKPFADDGIRATDSSHVLLKDVKVHGLSKGVHAGRLNDWTLDGVVLRANASAGWDGDVGAFNSSNSGNIIFRNSKIEYSGCGEQYPGTDIYGCFSQDQGGYGDGLGTHQTGGDWLFENTEISHNVSDGLDLLYHNGNGTVAIRRSRFEGNAGNAVKVATSAEIENSILISNCDYFANNPIAEQGGDPAYYTQAGFNNCRAAGTALMASGWQPGRWMALTNSLITGTSTILIEAKGDTCDGSEKFVSRNNIFLGMEGWYKKTHGEPGTKSDMFYLDGSDGNGAGPCGPSNPATKIKLDNKDSIAYNLKFNQCPNGNNVLCLDPMLASVPPLSGAADIYTYGERWNVVPQAGSPALDKAYSAVGSAVLGSFAVPGVDILGAARPFGAGIDWGAYEVGSSVDATPPAGPSGLAAQ